MSSKKLIKHYQRMVRDADRLRTSTACCVVNRETGIEYTDQEREVMFKASEAFSRAKDSISEIWSRRIGVAITSEIRRGEYKP